MPVKNIKLYFFVFLFYSILPIILVYSPTILNFQNKIIKSGDSIEILSKSLLFFDQFPNVIFNQPSRTFSYPDRYFYIYDSGIAIYILIKFFSLITNNYVFSYNVQIPIILGLSGLGAFLFTEQKFHNTQMAFLSGFFYSFNSISLQYYWAIEKLLAYSLIPFFFLAVSLFLKTDCKNHKFFFFSTLFLFLIGFSSLQIWILSPIPFFIFFLTEQKKIALKNYTKLLLIFLSSATLLSPILLTHYLFSSRYQVFRNIEEIVNTTDFNSFNKITELFTPYCFSYAHTQNFVSKYSQQCLRGDLYWFGMTSLIVILISLLFLKKQRNYLICSTFCFLFSLPQFIQVLNFFIPTPTYLLYLIDPLFEGIRVPARMLFYSNFFLSVFLASSLMNISMKKYYKFIFVSFVVSFYLLEHTLSHQFISYKQITIFDEIVWKELSKPAYGTYLEIPLPWFGGYEQVDPDETQEELSYIIHKKATPWNYPGFLSKSNANFLSFLLNGYEKDYFYPEKIKILSEIGVRNLVIKKSELTDEFRDAVNKGVLTIKYEDNSYLIVEINAFQDIPISFPKLSFECENLIDSSMFSHYEKRKEISITAINNTNTPLVQKQSQIQIDFEIYNLQNNITSQGNTWLELPLVVPSHSNAEISFLVNNFTLFSNKVQIKTIKIRPHKNVPTFPSLKIDCH